MEARLTQTELEELSAWLDGELPPAEAAIVAQRVRQDPVWTRAQAELAALDAALNVCTVPAAPEGLADRIRENVRRHRGGRIIRIVKYLAPAAAAAAIVLAVVIWQSGLRTGTTPAGGNGTIGQVDAALKGMNDEDKLAVEAMDFFKNYDVLDNFETLQAIDKLESQG